MRRFLMWMMICLLPLRLWAGDAMAVQHVPAETHEVMMAMAPEAHPCHGAENSTQKASEPVKDRGSACGDCSVCHGPLAGLTVPGWAAPALPEVRPHALGWSALSAIAPPQLKPPRA